MLNVEVERYNGTVSLRRTALIALKKYGEFTGHAEAHVLETRSYDGTLISQTTVRYELFIWEETKKENFSYTGDLMSDGKGGFAAYNFVKKNSSRNREVSPSMFPLQYYWDYLQTIDLQAALDADSVKWVDIEIKQLQLKLSIMENLRNTFAK